jgi:tungstate transport system permease protein
VALETSKGNLWLAVDLGLLLMIVVVVINVLAGMIRRAGERWST